MPSPYLMADALAAVRPPEDPSDPSWIIWLACVQAVAQAWFPNDPYHAANLVLSARRLTPQT